MSMAMKDEIKSEIECCSYNLKKWKILKTIYVLEKPVDDILKIYIRDARAVMGYCPTPLPEVPINAEYERLTSIEAIRRPEAIQRTLEEKKILESILSTCRTRPIKIYRSMWVGPYNVDLLILRSGANANSKTKGIAFEVDGGIHDRELKMKKDWAKIETLAEFSIAVTSLRNEDLQSECVQGIVGAVKGLRKSDTRSNRRLLRSLKLFTILSLASNERLNELFGFDFKHLISKCSSSTSLGGGL